MADFPGGREIAGHGARPSCFFSNILQKRQLDIASHIHFQNGVFATEPTMESLMKSVLENLKRSAGLAIACTALCSTIALADDDGRNNRRDFDRVFVIMMENHGFDQVIGALVPTADATLPNQQLLTPFITHLAQTQGLATYYFGTTHPSLPNYLATIAGDFFGVQDDNDSCFVQPGPTPGCHNFNTTNIVDQLESKNISWEALMNRPQASAFWVAARRPIRARSYTLRSTIPSSTSTISSNRRREWRKSSRSI
jgi:hypothetical protein